MYSEYMISRSSTLVPTYLSFVSMVSLEYALLQSSLQFFSQERLSLIHTPNIWYSETLSN